MPHHNMQEGINPEKNNPNAQKEDSTNSNLDLNRRSVLKLAGATAGAAAGGLGAVSHGSQEASAVSIGEAHTIDDFEDADLSEYEFDQGETGASVVTSPTYDGSYALEISGTDTEMISTTGLEEYPSAGSVFSYWVRATGGADDTNFAYGVQNHQNRYYVNLDFTNDHIIIFRYENDNSSSLNKTNVTLDEGTWYQVEVQWKEDGTHTATLYDSSESKLAQVSATDTTWKAGGIGFDAYAADGSKIYYDRATLDSGRDVHEFNRLIDSFEDGGLDEYAFVSGASGASVVSSPIVEGTSALELSGTSTAMHSTSGLENYPSQGDVFSTWVRATNGANDTNFKYGVQDGDNLYYVNLEFANDKMRFFTYKNGDSSSQSSASVTLNEDSWYRLEIDWRKTGKHIATVYDANGNQLQQISMTDSTWAGGGIGYSAYLSGSETIYYDQVSIHYSVVDDFEDGDISEYSGDTGSFIVQNTTVLEGSQTLKGTSAPSAIARSGISTPNGYVYEASVMAGSGSGAAPALMTNIQNPSVPLDNCYYLQIDPGNNKFALFIQESGNKTRLDQSSATIEEGVVYRMKFRRKSSGAIIGVLFDDTDTEIAKVAAVDRTFSDGSIGLLTEKGSPAFYDYLTITKQRSNVLDNFEDGDISEYDGNVSDYSVQSTTALEGEYTLKALTGGKAISHTHLSTPRGYQYRAQMVAEGGSGAKPGLLTNVQDPSTPLADCYLAQIDPGNNQLELIRREGGTITTLDAISVEINEGTEYQVGLAVHEQKVGASIYNEYGKEIDSTNTVTDTTFEGGYIGVYTATAAPAYFDYVQSGPIASLTATEVSTSQTVAKDALSTSLAQDVMAELNNPSADTANGTCLNAYLNDNKYVERTIKIPIEYGDLRVTYHKEGGSPKEVVADIDRSTMPSSLIDDLSDNIGWPSPQDGSVFHSTETDVPYFIREITDTEMADAESCIGRQEEALLGLAWNNNGGKYRIIHSDKIFQVNEQLDTVTGELYIGQGHSGTECESLADLCILEVGLTIYSCIPAGYVCGAALISPGGPFTAGACFVLVVATCAGPEAVQILAGASSCVDYITECT